MSCLCHSLARGTLLKLVHSTVDEELLGEAFLWPDSDEESAVLAGHGRCRQPRH